MTVLVCAVSFVLGYALGRLSRGLVRFCQRIWAAGEGVRLGLDNQAEAWA